MCHLPIAVYTADSGRKQMTSAWRYVDVGVALATIHIPHHRRTRTTIVPDGPSAKTVTYNLLKRLLTVISIQRSKSYQVSLPYSATVIIITAP